MKEVENLEYLEIQLTYETYYKLRQSVGWNNFLEEQTRVALNNSCYSLVVLDKGIFVGMARIIGDGLYYTIVDVVVSPEYQGRGIGRSLVEGLLKYIDNKTPLGGRVSIQLIAVKGKEEFYEKFGFKLIPNENSGSGMRKVINK